MLTNEVFLDIFGRISNIVHQVLGGIDNEDLSYRPTDEANTIAWLVWHLTRVQDDHIADLADTKQVWHSGWSDKFGLDLPENATGYGQSSDEVAKVKASKELLIGYFEDVNSVTTKYINSLKTEDYERVVDKSWDPPVTVGVRLVSIISDDLQHAGQAAYLKGLING